MHKVNCLEFLTVNTGHRVTSITTDVKPIIIANLKLLVKNGGGAIPNHPSYKVVVTLEKDAAIFHVEHKAKPLLLCTLVWNKSATDEIWSNLTSDYGKLFNSSLPAKKHQQNEWLGVLMLPELLQFKHFSALSWMGDFERCMAWAILDFMEMR